MLVHLVDSDFAPCRSCGLRLRSDVVQEGARLYVLHFCGREQVERCPRCQVVLDGNAIKPSRVSGRGVE